MVTVPTGPAPTQLVTKDLVTGTGQTAKAGDTVTVNYVGVLYKTGKEFDSSWSRNQPFTTPLTQRQRDPGLGAGNPRHEGRRPARADHPGEPRLRQDGQPPDDPA